MLLMPQCYGQAGGVQAGGSRFRLARSVSGSKGTPQGGRFAMEDPRSVFYIPDDHQVIIYMEWEGPPGKHHLEGFWRNPAGKISVMSDFDYDAKETKFGAYWTLALSDSMETGSWSLEAHIDGELAGAHAFQILTGTRLAGSASARKLLAPSELYEHALKSSVTIEKFDRSGQKFGDASGFLFEPSWIVTSFESIDGAGKLRVTYSDGSRFETEQVAAWNRRQDWAVLRAGATKLSKLKPAEVDSWNVGDTASFLDVAPEGNRVITNVSIEGKNSFAAAGPRLNISSAPIDRSIGAALLNEYGEVIAIVGGSLIPGASATLLSETASPVPRAGSRVYFRGGLAVPITTIAAPSLELPGTPLSTLADRGEFLPPVMASRNVVYGQLARSIGNKGGLPFPLEGGDVFSRRDPKLHVYVLWEGKEKAKGQVTMRIYTVDNQLLNKAMVEKPIKFSLGRAEQKVTSWEVEILKLPIGIYRVDVWMDDAPAWRTFFRITE
jgi:S1-C subfamily serine protease